MINQRCRYLFLLVFCGLLAITDIGLQSQEAPVASKKSADPPAPVQENLRPGILIPVSLPITQASAEDVRTLLEAAVNSTTASSNEDQFPVVLLEFDTQNSKTGRGSDFHQCLALAELLTDNRMNRLRTVAYIPGPNGLAPSADQLNSNPISHLKGHAVLVALACNELAMHNDSAIGQVGIDEKVISRTRTVAYEEIGNKRKLLPPPLIQSFIDKNLALFRVVKTDDQVLFVDRTEQESLRDNGEMESFRTISEEGTLALLTSQQLANFQLIRNRVGSRRQLAARLKVDSNSLEVDPSGGEPWNAVQLNVNEFVDKRAVNWLLRSMNQQSDSINLIIVKIDANDGDPFECLRLAEYLANFDAKTVKTVAYVPKQAGAAVSLIALSCDLLVMGESAKLGGAPRLPLEREEVGDLARAIKAFAPKTRHSWSVLSGFVDPTIQLKRMQNSLSGEIIICSDKEASEFDDADDWNSIGLVDVGEEGMTGNEAFQYQFSKLLINDFEQLKGLYQLTDDPVVLQPTATDRWIESFAKTLASPWVAGWLLFGAMFLLSTELSSPGIGIPGFLGTLCLIMFFWSQYFDGNAHWLEIMLFVAGAVFILMEIFVLPGFGIFGIGGLIMLVVSIVLATQTFVWPRNSQEFSQLPVSLTMVLAASAGFFVAIGLFGRYLPKTPFFKRMLLDPNEDGASPRSRSERESLVNWDHLVGESGVAVTRLAPAGKAKVGSQVVDVTSKGRFIEKGDVIEVIEVSGNRVVVTSAEATS